MPSIYQLNQPPNSFWDFVNGNLEDHPFFSPRGHHGHGCHARGGPHHENPPQYTASGENAEAGEKGENTASEFESDSPDNHRPCNHCGKGKGKGRHASHRGPGQFRGKDKRGKHGHGPHGHPDMKGPRPDGVQDPSTRAADDVADPLVAVDNSETSSSESDCADSHRHGHFKNKGRGRGRHGPGPFRGKGGKGKHGHGPPGPYDFHPHPHSHHNPGAFGFGPGRHGMHGMGHHGHGPHPGPYGFPGHHGHHGGPFGFEHRGPRGPGGPRHRGPHGGPFDFLRQIGAGLGFPMDKTADGVDFTPSVDVFDTPAKYIVHVSLPGAKRSDLSIDYDAEESVLRLAGRGREVGVFEREVRFGTRAAPAFVVVDGISAKLEDGILNVTLPKIIRDTGVQNKKNVWVDDGEKEKDATAERTLTPVDSEESENDGEAKEYVKVPVK
ncbi:HSP20-like chaperone [Penicillium brevicompactum]